MTEQDKRCFIGVDPAVDDDRAAYVMYKKLPSGEWKIERILTVLPTPKRHRKINYDGA